MTINATALMGLEYPDYDEPVREFPKRVYRVATALDQPLGGQWTDFLPQLRNGATSVAYDADQNIRYQKVGHRVTINARFVLTVGTSFPPYMLLPFAPAAEIYTYGLSIGFVQSFRSAGTTTSFDLCIPLADDGLGNLHCVRSVAMGGSTYGAGDGFDAHLEYDAAN